MGSKPLVVYDGDCGFCRRWIRTWRRRTGARVDYATCQEAAGGLRAIPEDRLREAVHLIEADGKAYSGAEAVFRALAYAPRCAWPLRAYRRVHGFAAASEKVYRFVASHRRAFSALERGLYGHEPDPPAHHAVRRLFTRLVALCFLIAFVSLWTQIDGLLGSGGILPAAKWMEAAARQLGSHPWRLIPSLAWLRPGDGMMHALCAAGTFAALGAAAGVLQGPCLLLCWMFYLSLVSIGQEFLSFQWDILLLETGFLTAFFAPWRGWDRPSAASPPSGAILWLLRWLLFRLMFESGCVKILSGDPTWRNLTALRYHYETQCLPTWIGWYAHQLPAWFQKLSVASMFAIELAVPWLIFAPRRPRLAACAALLSFQLLIASTGNYCFFNLLTATLCLPLVDDALLGWVLPQALAAALGPADVSEVERSCEAGDEGSARERTGFSRTGGLWGSFKALSTASLAFFVLSVSSAQLAGMLLGRPAGPAAALLRWQSPWRTVNSYGLFAVMTTTRNEIILEGSRDGKEWKAYEPKWKPGDPKRRPAFVAPHQPRLDWQLWFAVLGSYQENPWVLNLMGRLLEGSPPVLELLKTNPFPDAPPRYLRAVVYEYHFTNFAQRRADGTWWHRELKGLYAPVVAIRR